VQIRIILTLMGRGMILPMGQDVVLLLQTLLVALPVLLLLVLTPPLVRL